MDIYNLVSFSGIFVLVGFAWLLSSDRKNMNWRVVGWGIGLQLLIASFIFVVPAGADVFRFVNDVVVKVLGSASAGAELVFGRLALPPGQYEVFPILTLCSFVETQLRSQLTVILSIIIGLPELLPSVKSS